MQARILSVVTGCLLYATALTVFGQDLEGLAETTGAEFGSWMTLALRVLVAGAIMGVIYMIIHEFMGARRNGEYGVVLMPVLFGLALLVILAVLFAQAETAVQAVGGGG